MISMMVNVEGLPASDGLYVEAHEKIKEPSFPSLVVIVLLVVLVLLVHINRRLPCTSII